MSKAFNGVALPDGYEAQLSKISTLPTNCFIVGAAKCGTSSLFSYLAEHEDIFAPTVKEPHFFAPDVWDRAGSVVRHGVDYLELYSDVCRERVSMDGSTWYLRSQLAPHLIRRYQPDAKIIVMLRNPARMIISLHNHMYRKGSHSFSRFDDFFQDKDLGVLARRMMQFRNDLHRYMNVIDEKHIKIIIFEEFFQNPNDSIKDVFQFLKVSDRLEIDPKIVNGATQPNDLLLKRFKRKNPRLAFSIRQYTPQFLKSAGRRILSKLHETPDVSGPQDPNIMKEILDIAENEVALVENVLGRSLDVWREEPSNL